ncbi:hypothetical protein ACFWWM_14000 [Streptomyces sp. NPDC058682]|uniref:hypothetical protein n=1 Tax=unclassified Streptomyces TaxID=2593676 RepID=UPI002257054E|nr:hypothetical protein [Streptomyces sp. NBC_01214]MCX4807427.1 hypothetical protein [Streptomyces sp. NBC_01214]
MRDTLGTDMSMPGGAQAGRSIGVSKRWSCGRPCEVGLLSEPNVLIISQQGEQKRKLAIRSSSHTKGTASPGEGMTDTDKSLMGID